MTDPFVQLVRRGWLSGLADLSRHVPSAYRIAFLGAGLRAGILQRLATSPATVAELVADLGIDPSMADGLASWLDLGVALRELAVRDGRHRLRSRRAKRLVRPGMDALAAMVEEIAFLDHRLVAETPQRLLEGRPFVLGDADAAVIARSSRLGEPWIEGAVESFVPRDGAPRLLEVGCGSAVHIRTACRVNPRLTATGLELQEPAAAIARRNLSAWGLDGRVDVEVGDVRHREGRHEFDLVTLHQDIYYFPESEQAGLLRHLGSFLAPDGRILITSVVRGQGVAAAGLDLWGAMTEGAARMPVPGNLVDMLRRAGYVDVVDSRLGSDGMYHAFTATWPGGATGPAVTA